VLDLNYFCYVIITDEIASLLVYSNRDIAYLVISKTRPVSPVTSVCNSVFTDQQKVYRSSKDFDRSNRALQRTLDRPIHWQMAVALVTFAVSRCTSVRNIHKKCVILSSTI